MTRTFDERAGVRIIWLVTALALVAGYACVWQPSQRDLTSIRARAHDLYERANSNEEVVRRSSRLKTIEARVRADLVALGGRASAARVTASALQVLDFESKAYRVDVRALTPDASAAKAEAAGPERLVGQPMTIELRGRFRDVIALLADVPRHGVLFEIRTAELAADGRDREAAQPPLRATIQTTLYRIAASPLEENDAARSSR